MKKVLLSLLVLVLMIGSAVGGYFISEKGVFSSNNAKVTENQIVQKIDEFCTSAGWSASAELKKETATYSNLNDNSNVKEYNQDFIDYKGQESLMKSFLYIAKYTLLSDDIKENTFYISSAGYTNVDGVDVDYDATMGLYYNLHENDAYIYLYDFNLQTMVTVVVNIKPVYDNTYLLSVIMDCGDIQASSKGIILNQMYMDQNAENISQFSTVQITTNVNNIAELTLNDVNRLYFYGCDINLKQVIELNETSIKTEGIYTFDALKDVINKEIKKTQGVSFGLREYIEVNVLKEAYINLGYTVK